MGIKTAIKKIIPNKGTDVAGEIPFVRSQNE